MAFNMFVANIMARFSADTTGFDKSIRVANASLRRSAEDMTQLGRTMTMGITAPLMGIGIASGKMAMDFETSMTKIITLVGIGRREVESWIPAVKNMAGETGVAAGELAEALFYITSAGIRGSNALNVLEASAKASAIGLGETQGVAYAAVSAMNAYGEANLSAEMAVATLIRTVRMGNMEAKSLPMAFGRVLPVAAELGIKFQDVGASIAMMTRSGVTARLAAFALRSIMMTMVAPTHESTKAMHKLGITWEEIRQIAVKDGLLNALQRIKEATGGNAEAFQKVIPNSRAFIGALQLVGKNAEYSGAVFEHLAETVENDVAVTFDEWSKTSAADFKKGLAEISEAAVDFGSTLMGVTKALRIGAQAVSGVAKGFYALPPILQLSIHTFTGFIAVTGTLVLATGLLVRAKAGLVGITQKLIGVNAMEVISSTTLTARTDLQALSYLRLVVAKRSLNVAMVKGVAGMGAGVTQLTGLGLAAGVAGTAVAALAVGFASVSLGLWISDITGLTKAIADAKEPVEELTDSVHDLSMDAYYDLRKNTLKLAEAQDHHMATWIKTAYYTKDNAEILAKLNYELTKTSHEMKEAAVAQAALTDAEKHSLEYQSDDQKLKRARLEMMAALNKELREEYDLLTAPEVRTAVRELAGEYENLIGQGFGLARIWEVMEEKLKETLKLQYEYGETAPESIRAMAAAMKEEGIPAFQNYLDKLDAGTGALDDLKDKLSGTYDVMTRQDVKDSFASILKDMNAMKEAGIPMEEIWRVIEPKMKKAAEWAEKYGMGVSDGFREMNYELMNNGITALDTYIGKLGIEFTKKIDDLPGMLKPGMEAIKEQLGEELKGGFGKGYESGRELLTDHQNAVKDQLQTSAATGLGTGFGYGFETGRTQAKAFIDEMAQKKIVIPVVPDYEVWAQFFRDLQDGRVPDTGG